MNECGEVINNYNAYVAGNPRAFTTHNHREIFRINHYRTKSLEDLKAKCNRGYSYDGPNPKYDDILAPFKGPLVEDYSIKPYADIVRKKYT